MCQQHLHGCGMHVAARLKRPQEVIERDAARSARDEHHAARPQAGIDSGRESVDGGGDCEEAGGGAASECAQPHACERRHATDCLLARDVQ